MSHPFVLSFKENVSLIEQSSDRTIIQLPLVPLNIPQTTLNLDHLSSGLRAAVKTLADQGSTEEELSNLVLQTDGISGLPQFYYYLQKFIDLGMVCHTVLDEGLPLATRVSISSYDKFQLRDVVKEQKYVLSRFTYCHKSQEHLVIESPLAHSQIIVADWKGAALVSELTKPRTVGELSHKIPSLSEETIESFFSLLLSSEMIGEVNEDGKTQEEKSETLVQWEFHDLLFHARSRTGRHDSPVGRTYRFYKKIDPLPAVKPKIWNETIDLYKPDIQKLKEKDYSFTQILEERRTIRSYKDDEPITDQQLGEFLYRAARIREVIQTDREEISDRPYPNGGAAYELELYITVNTCKNIPSGLYHYCPKDHQLCRISERNSYVEALLEEGWLANRERNSPQILIIMAARFQRISWLYETLAYAGILKNVGALLQTMYLVATAMNLAPCAIGDGNSDLFATAIGADCYTESSVGELILGSKPRD